MTSRRVANKGRVDRSRPLSFTFNGKALSGFAGDTLASALLANDISFVARSFKYHRPRGILSAGPEEPNALVAIDRGGGRFDPNTRATTLELYEGLSAESQNHWPSLRWDVGAVNDMAHPFLSAGFYYKTFMWPRSFWRRIYEPVIRRAAGLGPAPTAPDPDRYASRYAFCDVLIAGAGPAGLAAALAAADAGLKVMLADEQNEPGGALLAEPSATIDGAAAADWLNETVARLKAHDNVTILTRTTAFGIYHDNLAGLCQRLTDHLSAPPDGMPRERLWRVRAKKIILAQGAIERPLLFPGNDRPGVMLANAAGAYLHRYGVRVGDRAIVATTHDSAWRTAFDLIDAGGSVAAIIDRRSDVDPTLLAESKKRGVETILGGAVVGTSGHFQVRSAQIQSDNKPPRSIDCDCVLMSGGWTPSVHLHSHAQGGLVWRDDIGAFIPAANHKSIISVGACAGCFDLQTALEDGAKAGAGAAATTGQERRFAIDKQAAWTGGAPIADDAAGGFLDFQNDVKASDIRQAVHEGFHSVEHAKRYTTNGMATDQGKTSNLNALAVSAAALGRTPQEAGLTKFRPPYTPTTFGALAGFNQDTAFEVTRKTPIDPWAEAHGAVFEPVGLWRRARYFPRTGETMRDAVSRECAGTRRAVGMFDASTLGKIEVVGPDAAAFLERMYVNPWKKLKAGRCRYGVLLGEDGFIYDDGVVARLADDRFHVTTTTGGAPRVLNMMEDYLQTEWPDLDVWLTSITEQWTVIAVSGPKSKTLIEPFIKGINLDDDALPHMSYAEGRCDNVDLRLFRVSFNGERGYELNIPSGEALKIWELLYDAGQRYDVVVYGTEAMHVMRAEKGFIIVGQDTDGTVTPQDAGLGWAISKKKPDFVGKRSLTRPDMLQEHRPQIVGLFTENPNMVLEEGAQIVSTSNENGSGAALGHVTSSYWSETLGRSIALGLVSGGRARTGETVASPSPNGERHMKITTPVFYDPDGARLNA